MNEVADLSQRVADLEMHVSYRDKVIDDLNEMVTKQWAVIEGLKREIDNLNSRLDEVEDQSPSGTADQRPPHH